MIARHLRRLACTAAPIALTVALVGAGTANAEIGEQCSGANIGGQGSAAQRLAQSVWTPAFNTSAATTACSGTQGSKAKPTIAYTANASGTGMESWGVAKHAASFGPSNAFIATDEPPNAAQKGQIELNESKVVPETLATIPVAEMAVAILVNLPSGCTATSGAKGRLQLDNLTLEKIFRGAVTKWSELSEGGNELKGASCNTATAIKPIVRKDEAGTTHILKNYLGLINFGTVEAESGASETWEELAEGPESTVWPKAAKVTKPAASGETELLKKIAETPGSIGYANLADARAYGAFTPGAGGGGPETARFWTRIQRNGIESPAPKYDDPATNEDVEAPGEADCKDTEFSNGNQPFPPFNAFSTWNHVSTSIFQKKYPLCGLTYDLALTNYADYPGTSLTEATTVSNYLRFVLASTGIAGQKAILKHDYFPLPKGAILEEAERGQKAIEYNAAAEEEPGVVIGANTGSGWGKRIGERLVEERIDSDRIEMGRDSIAASQADGFSHQIVIVGNTPDSTPLSSINVTSWVKEALTQVEEVKAAGLHLCEVGNEMFLKGPREGSYQQKEPAKYAEMYMALAHAVDTAKITGIKLLFNAYGDYQLYEGGPFSQVASGHGWIGDAVAAQPELKSRVDGFTGHPYGKPKENRENDWGPGSTMVQHEQIVGLGFAHSNFWISEFGIEAPGSTEGSSHNIALSEEEENNWAREVYGELTATGWVKGIWWYNSHDDSTAEKWGLFKGRSGVEAEIFRSVASVISSF
jgi:ABC-type phosphate transport system substrate-binding protein